MKLIRRPENPYSSSAVEIEDRNGKSLGHVPAVFAESISPMIDFGLAQIEEARLSYLLRLSERSKRCRKAIAYVTVKLQLEKPVIEKNSTAVCFLHGSRQFDWLQKLDVIYTRIPPEKAELIFELYNRMQDEFKPDINNTDYCILDGIAEETAAARMKRRSRINPAEVFRTSYADDVLLEDILAKKIVVKNPRFEMKEAIEAHKLKQAAGGPDVIRLDSGQMSSAANHSVSNGTDEDFEEDTPVMSDLIAYALVLTYEEPKRYGKIRVYLEEGIGEADNQKALQQIFRKYAADEEEYCWRNYCRINGREFTRIERGIHRIKWYDIAEIFRYEDFDFDFSDPDVVSILGSGKFLDMADLSYGS